MTSGADKQGGAGNPVEVQRPPRLSTSFAIVGLILVLLQLAAHVVGRIDAKMLGTSWLAQAAVAVAAAVAGTLMWGGRRWMMRTLTSLPFSVAMIACLLVLTAIGTVVLQQAPPAAYSERHGQALAAVLLALGLDDIFHSFWFAGLLAVQAFSLVLTAIEKRAWRVHMWGHMLSHLGFVTVLIGGLIGSRYGFKGLIDLHEGQASHEARLLGKEGYDGPVRELGFSVKLEKFALETYTPEAKFYVYQREGEGYRAVRAFEQKDALAQHPIGSSGASFHLVAAYPDFYLKPEVREAPAGKGAPVLQVDFKQGEWSSRAALLAGVAGRDATELSAEGPAARFVWATPSDAELARFAESTPEGHVVALRLPGASEAEEVAVAIGATGQLPKGGFEIEAQEYLPDFTYDSKAKKATTRSTEPNNPALRVLIRDLKSKEEKTRWLFAKMPDFGHGEGEAAGPKFVYRHESGRQAAEREFLIVGEANQLWRLERGRVVQRLPLEQWQSVCTGLPVVGMQVHASAVIEGVPASRSPAWDNPVADIVVEEAGATREVRLATEHEQPLALADGKTFLAFELHTDEPKTFRSQLTILEAGRPVAKKEIVVNDPLSYQGHMFYQSNFRKDDPTYSGITVVRDPGLGIVFAGFVMMSIGVIFIYYIRPRLMAGMGEQHGH